MAQWLKSVLGWMIAATGLHRLLLGDRAVIVVFHRVQEAFPGDPIGCSREKFTAFCDFFRKHFEVVSLDDLIRDVAAGRPLGGRLVISFDDGYRDNYEVAYPILAERDLPACFFIATGYIDSDRVAGWDADHGVAPAWMTWGQVRELHQAGFEIGAHTVNHVNLGTPETFARYETAPFPASWDVDVSAEEAVQEIATSKKTLEAELSAPVTLFSYPFGRHENLSPENAAAIQAMDFACCASAYGGLVKQDSSLFDLPRIPVSPWHSSPTQFLFEILRLR